MNALSITMLIIGIIVLVFNLSIFGVLIYLALKTFNKNLDFKQFELQGKILDGNINIYNLIDGLVNTALSNYIIFHTELESTPYLNDEIQNKIVKEISTEIVSSMSPSLYDYICVFINNNVILDTINRRVIIAVMGFAIEKNGSIPLAKK